MAPKAPENFGPNPPKSWDSVQIRWKPPLLNRQIFEKGGFRLETLLIITRELSGDRSQIISTWDNSDPAGASIPSDSISLPVASCVLLVKKSSILPRESQTPRKSATVPCDSVSYFSKYRNPKPNKMSFFYRLYPIQKSFFFGIQFFGFMQKWDIR